MRIAVYRSTVVGAFVVLVFSIAIFCFGLAWEAGGLLAFVNRAQQVRIPVRGGAGWISGLTASASVFAALSAGAKSLHYHAGIADDAKQVYNDLKHAFGPSAAEVEHDLLHELLEVFLMTQETRCGRHLSGLRLAPGVSALLHRQSEALSKRGWKYAFDHITVGAPRLLSVQMVDGGVGHVEALLNGTAEEKVVDSTGREVSRISSTFRYFLRAARETDGHWRVEWLSRHRGRAAL
jgi:hypothetical protein